MSKNEMSPKKFIQVFINGDEKNLPKEKGQYWTKAKRDFKHVISLSWFATTNNPDNIMLQWWLNDVEWYLTPIEQPEESKEAEQSEITDLKQYLTNLAYSSYTFNDNNKLVDDHEFDEYVEQQVELIDGYIKSIQPQPTNEPRKTAEEILASKGYFISVHEDDDSTGIRKILIDPIIEAMEEYRNQAVQLPSEEEINEKYPSEFGDSVIMESGKSYEEVVIANRFRKEGAKWVISKLTP